MENLAFAQKIIKPHTVDPLEGHTVVVLERIGTAGEEFRFEIEPGQRLPKTGLSLFNWLNGRKADEKYFAYAVNGDPELSVTYSVPVTLDDQHHTIDVLVRLAYHAADPQLIVRRRNDDPVRKVREKTAAMLTRQLASHDWASLRADFRDIEEGIHSVVLPSLRQFAAQYGLEVHTVGFDYRLRQPQLAEEMSIRTEKLEHKKNLTRKTREHELRTLELEQESELADLEETVDGARRRKRVGDAGADALITAMGNAAERITTPTELRDAIAIMRDAGNPAPLTLGGGAVVRGALGSGNSSQSGASSLLAEMLVNTDQMVLSFAEKRQLQSAMLHLVAELLLEGSANPAVVASHSKRIDDLRNAANLPLQQFDYLKKFIDPKLLQAELR